jgi:hypothetical protein
MNRKVLPMSLYFLLPMSLTCTPHEPALKGSFARLKNQGREQISSG